MMDEERRQQNDATAETIVAGWQAGYAAGVADAKPLRDALDFCVLALNDWLHVHAETECSPDDVARSKSRIKERGGTIAYIAEVLATTRAALAATEPKP